MINKDRYEKAIGNGWFAGNYTAASAALVAEQQGLSFTMIQHWYGINYESEQRQSQGQS